MHADAGHSRMSPVSDGRTPAVRPETNVLSEAHTCARTHAHTPSLGYKVADDSHLDAFGTFFFIYELFCNK